MSMYHLIFGVNPSAQAILATLQLTPADVGRFRDCFVADGEIVVYTRNGGGNRPDYQPVFDRLRAHPDYLRDADDDFDATYATIYFRLPDAYAEILRPLDIGGPFDPSQRWKSRLAAMERPDYTPPAELTRFMSELVGKLKIAKP